MKEKETLTPEQSDALLSRVLEKQVAFKSDRLRLVCCVIVKAALARNGDGIYPDDPSIVAAVSHLAAGDKNVVGSAWRLLGKVKLLTRCAGRRPSTAPNSHGREIAQWGCGNRNLCETFLRRNAAAFSPAQQELFGGGK